MAYMLPKIAIVGQPNVGKSTLFNSLTKTRDALVSAKEGMTRDCLSGVLHSRQKSGILVDTGGWLPAHSDILTGQVLARLQSAIEQASLVLFVVDGISAKTACDQEIAAFCRRKGKELWLVINKLDLTDSTIARAEFADLGIERTFVLSARFYQGINALRDALQDKVLLTSKLAPPEDSSPLIVLAGKPNSGKSTLINRLIGKEEMITSSIPGTTRNSVEYPFEFARRLYRLLDTAGIRRKARKKSDEEVLSILQTYRGLAKSPLAVLVCDATTGITDQDAQLAGEIQKSSCAMVIAVNKCDKEAVLCKKSLKHGLERRFKFLPHVEIKHISALQGRGLKVLMRAIHKAHTANNIQMSTSECNRLLQAALSKNPPPSNASGKRPKLRYMKQISVSPPEFAIHGTRLNQISQTYNRYLTSFLTKSIGPGIQVTIDYKTTANPFVD